MTSPAAGELWGSLVKEAHNPWQVVLAVGQIVFFTRFLVQWIATERLKKVVVPVSFWWLSLVGAAVSLVALLALRQPVMVVAQVVGIALYLRNLVIQNRQTRAEAGTGAA